MWDVDYDDYEENTCAKERAIFDIKYNEKKQKILKSYMKEKNGIF